MKSIYPLHRLLTFVFVVFFSFQSQAKFPGALTRFQLGYSFVKSTADYDGKLKMYNGDGDFTGDTQWHETVHTTAAYGISIGTYIPITRLGRVSTLATNIDFTYDFKFWKNVANGLYSQVPEFDISGLTLEVGLPITLDFKFGCDATSTKNQHFCTSIGAGIYPSYALTSFEDNTATGFSVAPVVKYEVGFFKGICMKFRLLYSLDNIKYISKDGSVFKQDDLASDFTLKGKSTFTISAIFMPMSFLWKKKGWWDSY